MENQAPLAQSIEFIGKEEQNRTKDDDDCGNIKRKSRDQRLHSFEDRRLRGRLSYGLRLGDYCIGGLWGCCGSLRRRLLLKGLPIWQSRRR